MPIDEIERLVTRDAAAEVLPLTRITRPARGITDEFLRDVAGAYQHLVTARQRPVPTMARDAGVSIPTVYRWVAMARERGLLPPERHAGGRKPTMTPKKLAVAREMYDSKKHTMKEIAQTVGVCPATIYRHLEGQK